MARNSAKKTLSWRGFLPSFKLPFLDLELYCTVVEGGGGREGL